MDSGRCDHVLILDGRATLCNQEGKHYFSIPDASRRTIVMQAWACDHHRHLVRARIHEEAMYMGGRMVEETKRL
jgi:hypothetical protein